MKKTVGCDTEGLGNPAQRPLCLAFFCQCETPTGWGSSKVGVFWGYAGDYSERRAMTGSRLAAILEGTMPAISVSKTLMQIRIKA